MRIDHIVIVVADLPQAIVDYTTLGFTVERFGDTADGLSESAIIAFEDGSALELFAYKAPAENQKWWQILHADGDGLADIALRPDDFDAAFLAATDKGIELYGPFQEDVTRPDGTLVSLKTAYGRADLPFLVTDMTDVVLRHGVTEHANGVRGLASVTLATENAVESLKRLKALLGPDVPSKEYGMVASVTLGTAQLRVVGSPRDPENPVTQRLMTRGEGPLALTLRGAPGAMGEFDTRLSHGVRMALVPV